MSSEFIDETSNQHCVADDDRLIVLSESTQSKHEIYNDS